jgi:hypothetical protein
MTKFTNNQTKKELVIDYWVLEFVCTLYLGYW